LRFSSKNGSRYNHRDYEQIRRPDKNNKIKKRSGYKRVVFFLLLIILFASFCFGAWFYWWTQHARFEYALQSVVILDGQQFQANDFIYTHANSERLIPSFTNPNFRPGPGAHSVSLTLSLGWRSLETTARLYVLTTTSQFSHEFRESAPELSPVDFVTNASVATGISLDVLFVEEPLLLEEYEVGEHILFLTLRGMPFEVLLNVVDTTPPTAVATTVVLNAGETAEPRKFILNPYDASGVESIEFVNTPDFMSDREQIIEIEIIDYYGNSDIFRSELRVILNKENPVIEGTDTIISMVENPIIYLRGVTAYDDMGRELDVYVDSSGVDLFTVGEYTVLYYAVDATGNRTEITETVFIIDIDIDYVYTEVDRLLGDILNDGMSQLEKVRAIHRWIRTRIGWGGGRGGPPTVYEAAYRALHDRSGNCFNFYALAEVMLTRAGVPNMLIERIPGTLTRHRWNLVNPDDLGWHHFDSTPTRLGWETTTAFFTDSQARALSERIRVEHGRADYFTYNPELYPEIVE
jgi:transglutaminase-like putative cysteine protease